MKSRSTLLGDAPNAIRMPISGMIASHDVEDPMRFPHRKHVAEGALCSVQGLLPWQPGFLLLFSFQLQMPA